MRTRTTLTIAVTLLLGTSAVAQPALQRTRPRPPVTLGRPAPTLAPTPDLRRQLDRPRPQAARDPDPVRRRDGWISAGAPPDLRVEPRPSRLTPVTPSLPNGIYMSFNQAWEVVAQPPGGYASFSGSSAQQPFVAIFIPGSETRGQAFDCAISGVGALYVSVVRLAPPGSYSPDPTPIGPVDPISASNVTTQNGHVFIYVPPDTSGLRRAVVLSTSGVTWWFFNCVTQPA